MDTLPIINRLYELYKLIVTVNNKLEKRWRYSLGQGLETTILDCLEQVIMAKNAKYHFEHGTYEDKTLILRTLGSNFYILDGKLCVDLIKPFLIFKEHKLDVQATFETIELPEFAMVGANSGDFEHWFVKWSG